MTGGIRALDWMIVIVYLIAIIGVGFAFSRRNRTTDAYFKGGGKLLVTGYAPVTDMAGLYGLNIGANNYPLVSVNTTDDPVKFPGNEEPYAAGEVRVTKPYCTVSLFSRTIRYCSPARVIAVRTSR